MVLTLFLFIMVTRIERYQQTDGPLPCKGKLSEKKLDRKKFIAQKIHAARKFPSHLNNRSK